MSRYYQRPQAQNAGHYNRPQDYYATDSRSNSRNVGVSDDDDDSDDSDTVVEAPKPSRNPRPGNSRPNQYSQNSRYVQDEDDYEPPKRANSSRQNSYNQPPANYYTTNTKGITYADEGNDDGSDDEETMVQTDVSALPPHPAHMAHAKFRENPVRDTLEFDNTLPPDAIHAPRRNNLTVPSQQRPRASSLDSRYTRPDVSAAPPSRQVAPPRQELSRQMGAPPTRQMAQPTRQMPQPSRQPPPSSGDSYRREASSRSYAQQSNPYGNMTSLRDYLPQGEDEGGDSDDDIFTAVSTGLATDMDVEDDVEEDNAPQRIYNQDPRASHHHRSASYDNRGPPPQSDWRRSSGVYDNTPAPPPPRPSRQQQDSRGGYSNTNLAPPRDMGRPASTGSIRAPSPARSEPPPRSEYRQPPPPPQRATPSPVPLGSVPEDTPEEKNLIRLLKDMNFSAALKDFHTTFGIGVQKTLVASDGIGHAYVKIHVKKLPKPSDLKAQVHLAKYWTHIGGNRWNFATESHKVEVIFKSIALATYESSQNFGRR